MLSSFLFVYGTLMDGQGNGLLAKIGAVFVGRGTIRAKLYDLGKYPGAKPSVDSTDRVRGEVYRLLNSANSLAVLDEYEGISMDAASKSAFVRETARVSLDDGRELSAWVYLYGMPVSHARLIPGGDYRAWADRAT